MRSRAARTAERSNIVEWKETRNPTRGRRRRQWCPASPRALDSPPSSTIGGRACRVSKETTSSSSASPARPLSSPRRSNSAARNPVLKFVVCAVALSLLAMNVSSGTERAGALPQRRRDRLASGEPRKPARSARVRVRASRRLAAGGTGGARRIHSRQFAARARPGNSRRRSEARPHALRRRRRRA